MNFEVIGLHPDNALKVALDIFDEQVNDSDKVKILLNNRSIKNLNSVSLPKNFISGKTIDLNVGELLGIGCVSAFYMWNSKQAGRENTYQAVVGVEDAAKSQIENVLSNGAVYHDQSNKKILAQQVMTQGFYPKKQITNDDVIIAIEKKLEQRDRYPEHCILIVNAFSDNLVVDRKVIGDAINKLPNSYTDVYLVVYNLPILTMAHVSCISEPDARGLAIKLERHPHDDEWHFNYDSKRPRTKLE